MHLVEFRNIKKRYEKRFVLNNFSLNVVDGEVLGLIGRSGSGKSTVLKILVGMTDIDGGIIYFNGVNVAMNLKVLRRETGFATQENMLIEELSIWENSLYFGKLYGLGIKNIKARFRGLINLLDLSGFENFTIRQLSGGMQKRANLLVALIHSPRLLILDEPTAGLDNILRESLWSYIHQINREGTTIFITSHLLEEIEKNCDRIAIMKSGSIATLGSMEDYTGGYPGKDLTSIFTEVLKNENILNS
jgi:ABC-2 type transport system ATP-binding protein